MTIFIFRNAELEEIYILMDVGGVRQENSRKQGKTCLWKGIHDTMDNCDRKQGFRLTT